MTQRRSIELDLQLEIREYLQRMEQSVRAAVKGATRMGDAFDGVQSSLQTLAGVAGLAFGVNEVVSYIGAIHEARTEIVNLSEATGLSTQTFGAFQLAAGRSGVEVDEILGGFEDFGEVLFDFTQGGGRAEEALRMLGFTSEGLAGRLDDVDGVAVELIEQMRGIEDAGLKNAVAQQLFGDAGNRLNAILGDAPLQEWIAAANELGVTVDDRAAAATERWNESLAILGETVGQTGGDLLTLGQEVLSPVLVTLAKGFSLLEAVVRETLAILGEELTQLGRIGQAVLAGDFSGALQIATEETQSLDEKLRRIGQAAIDDAVAFHDTQAAVADLTKSVRRQSTALTSLTEDTEKQSKATRELADDHRRLDQILGVMRSGLDELASAQDALADLTAEATRDQLGDVGAILAQRDEQLEQLRDLEAVTRDTAAARVAAAAIEARAVRDLNALEQRLHDERLARLVEIQGITANTVEQITDGLGSLFEAQLDTIGDAASATRDALDETVARIGELNDQLVDETDARVRAELGLELGHLAELRTAQEAELEAEQARYAAQFEARKALEIAGILVSGASAAIAALAPPPIGAGPIAGALLAGGIAVTTGVAVAEVASQQPPQFHTGFAGFTDAPDEYPVRLTRSETVNNPRATEALGGPAGVAELNETGQLPTAPRGRGRSASELGRTLGRLLVDELDAGRELSHAVRRRPRLGVRPVFPR